MASCSRVLLFPYEHTDVHSALHDLNVRSRTHFQLRRFLDSASIVVQEQISRLNVFECESIGNFEDLVELAERHVSQQSQSVVVEMVLMNTIQVGQLLVLAGEDASVLSDSSIPIGLGVGLIAATVAATASDIDSIVTIGLTGLVFAFHLALDLERVSRQIEGPHGEWAHVISGYDLEEVQCRLDKVNGPLRSLQQAYIGQVMPGSIVVFGPPSTLQALVTAFNWNSSITNTLTPTRCLMFGAHLPPAESSEAISFPPALKACIAYRPLYSGHSPKAENSGQSLSELLRLAVSDIRFKSMQIQDTFRAVATAICELGSPEVVLTTLGSSWNASTFEDILRQSGHHIRIVNISPCQRPFSNDTIPDAIAVVGMSGRFPESDTLDELWRLLEAGTTTHRDIPSSRFNVNDFYDTSRGKHNCLISRHGCFIKKPGLFDHRLFNISPKEALQMDPVQRMLLMSTYEALEMAGHNNDHNQTPSRIAVYFGQTTDDWKTINEQQGIDTHFLPAVNRSFAPGRLSHYFRWAGGFYSIDTGCSSSATGICLARDALMNRECDAAVVGGGTLLTAPQWFSGLGKGGFLSPTGACKTYTNEADGYCRGEAVAVVVLKRLSDAIRMKDNVLGVIAGAARNTNAGESSITHPSAKSQEILYRRVLRQAAIRPQEVAFIEMHGTGTQAGDRVETMAVRNVFASEGEPRRVQPLVVGAIKASVGHSEAAAGVVSLIKVILALRRGIIPPQPNQPIKLNPRLASILGPGKDVQIANGQKWPKDGSNPRYALVNNFDAAGGNVSVLICDTLSHDRLLPFLQSKMRSHHIVVISGRTETAQMQNKDRIRRYLRENPETHIDSLAYTTTTRRMQHNIRDAYVTTSVTELLRQLEQPRKQLVSASSVVFVFTGQGSQYAGMGSVLYRTWPMFRRLLDSYQRLCNAQGLDCNILDLISGSEDVSPKNTTNSSRDLQVAAVAIGVALARIWQLLGIHPNLLIGHSLGEYAALCVAGVLSVSDALVLAYERAKLISTRCSPSETGMLAVGLSTSII